MLGLCDLAVDAARCERLAYFHGMLDQHLDLVARRLLNAETIPAHEKVLSLFEPLTAWIQKGKQQPNMELGQCKATRQVRQAQGRCRRRILRFGL